MSTTHQEDQEIFGAPKNAKPIDFSGVHKMFDAAVKSGLKKPKFFADNELRLSLAPATGKNPGAIYLTVNTDYAGKIVNGRLQAVAALTTAAIETLRKIAEDPYKAAVDYGKATGVCCMCGLPLSNPESVRLGIGPICGGRWGFAATEVVETSAEVEEKPVSSLPPYDSCIIMRERAVIGVGTYIQVDQQGECVVSHVPGNHIHPFRTYYLRKDGTSMWNDAALTIEDAVRNHRRNVADRQNDLRMSDLGA